LISTAAAGLHTVRDAVRWHLIEATPGRYDWSSLLPMLRAARDSGVQVTWDLCHYGLPHDLDIWSPRFLDRFAAFCAAVARVVRAESGGVPFYCPVNEISFWAWAGGDHARMHPNTLGRGPWTRSCWTSLPRSRGCWLWRAGRACNRLERTDPS